MSAQRQEWLSIWIDGQLICPLKKQKVKYCWKGKETYATTHFKSIHGITKEEHEWSETCHLYFTGFRPNIKRNQKAMFDRMETFCPKSEIRI
uniref:Uncharacterized protein isoform X2 n=2 Tax=Nicotiana TaxID=4085 RepID=A0A1S4AT16_TOBAC|nr:PREDICTED: uncharacterized protein LOC104233342 isoform X2 [Nicotiana sylvestris]XP_016479731.1 PREDICTED: uncharacterized protein LOC107800977 isoform X2 [Nicotiana tabacum]